MAAFIKVRNEDCTWNVVDSRSNKAVKSNLKAAKADAWVTIKNEELVKAEALWASWEK